MEQYIKGIKFNKDNAFDDKIINLKTTINKGMINFSILGLSKINSIQSKERILSAFNFYGIKFPHSNVKIHTEKIESQEYYNLLDLPIAISILYRLNKVKDLGKNVIFIGEIGIDGNLQPLSNPYRAIRLAIDNEFSEIILPKSDYYALSDVEKIKISYASNLGEVINYLNGKSILEKPDQDVIKYNKSDIDYDINDIVGQKALIRAMVIAIAGRHKMFIKGPIGSGKSISIKAIESIMPKLNQEKQIKNNDIFLRFDNKSNLDDKARLIYADFYTKISDLFGNKSKIGIDKMIDQNYLVLDEFNVFSKNVVESIKLLIDRSINKTSFGIFALMNPCPCGDLNTNNKCSCTMGEINRHNSKISPALLDRFDIKLNLHLPKIYKNLDNDFDIDKIINSIENAIQIQYKRYGRYEISNGNLDSKMIDEYLSINNEYLNFIDSYINDNGLSRRCTDNILKVARTIADIEDKKDIEIHHIYEAISYQKFN